MFRRNVCIGTCVTRAGPKQTRPPMNAESSWRRHAPGAGISAWDAPVRMSRRAPRIGRRDRLDLAGGVLAAPNFMRNLLTRVPKNAQSFVAAMVRTIFAQPDAEMVHESYRHLSAATQLRYIRRPRHESPLVHLRAAARLLPHSSVTTPRLGKYPRRRNGLPAHSPLARVRYREGGWRCSLSVSV